MPERIAVASASRSDAVHRTSIGVRALVTRQESAGLASRMTSTLAEADDVAVVPSTE
jgi:hypothetical protein